MILAKRLSFGFLLAAFLAMAAGLGGSRPAFADSSDLITNPGIQEDDLRFIIAGSKKSDDNNVVITADFGEGSQAPKGTLLIQITYGLSTVLAAEQDEGLAKKARFKGDGKGPETALRVESPDDPAAAIDAAFSYLALHYPQRSDQQDGLYADSQSHFFMRVDFTDGGTAQTLYFDVTAWAKSIDNP